MIILGYRSILKSRKHYDDMCEYMNRERELIKSDRIKITDEITRLKGYNKMDNVNLIAFENSLNKSNKDFESLAKRYISLRIKLLRKNKPNLTNSQSSLDRLQELLNKRKTNNIDRITYLNKVDIFDKLTYQPR